MRWKAASNRWRSAISASRGPASRQDREQPLELAQNLDHRRGPGRQGRNNGGIAAILAAKPDPAHLAQRRVRLGKQRPASGLPVHPGRRPQRRAPGPRHRRRSPPPAPLSLAAPSSSSSASTAGRVAAVVSEQLRRAHRVRRDRTPDAGTSRRAGLQQRHQRRETFEAQLLAHLPVARRARRVGRVGRPAASACSMAAAGATRRLSAATRLDCTGPNTSARSSVRTNFRSKRSASPSPVSAACLLRFRPSSSGSSRSGCGSAQIVEQPQPLPLVQPLDGVGRRVASARSGDCHASTRDGVLSASGWRCR